ncbi:putative transmembrane ascorbate ferrireductase 4 isoform X2 [Nicotiana tabacum]|uniref:Transmembrane ascorbate ferrireductase 4 isoform X2 n=2 Tax=Nicotiana TaxID=4085 RepID=A0A1S3YPY9_TOBAC|nr:PREDICTED: probable transmembrane ascorbate ferrireductase 4 isoform X2 [Nicotiana sylvestris]XP_016454276.1 PREDICTED: probable transmembrane ascorbate ferrireductase 4 isoform X2 [Nicotiana tabacum]
MAAAEISLSLSPFSLLVLARFSGSIVALLVLTWALHFKTSFYPHSSSKEDLIYAVLHPLLMVIGFILISGEGLALACGIFGIWTKFHSRDGIVANFYSLHSWMGLFCVSLFGAQWLMGFLSFWHRGEVRMTRIRILPWHVFLGLYTYGLAVATAETGLLEKLTFLQTKGAVQKRCTESMIVNGMGLSLALLSGMVIFAAVLPKHQTPHSKTIYSSNKLHS